MDNFVAIDFETANNERTSVCSVGVVIVRNGEIVDSFIHLFNQNQIITTIGVLKYMELQEMILIRLQYFLKFGNKSNHL